MKVAIIEDEPVHAELLAGYLKNWGRKRQVLVEIIHYASAENFLFEWETERDFTILFVDIQMEKMNGMDMAKLVRKRDGEISIIFTTGVPDYIEEGYEVEAIHYLMKPINEKKIAQCMDKVMSRSSNMHYILVNSKDEVYKVAAEQINYIEARGHGCVIETVCREDGKIRTELLEVKEGISNLESQVGPYGLVKCHRSYLCGIRNIHHIGRAEIVFDNGSSIPVSRRHQKEVNQAFIRYFRKYCPD